MKRVNSINEWKSFKSLGFFQVIYFQAGIAIGKVALLSFAVAPGLSGTCYISAVVLGFGFSMLVGTPRNKDIFR